MIFPLSPIPYIYPAKASIDFIDLYLSDQDRLAFGDDDSVFKLRREAAVAGFQRPAIGHFVDVFRGGGEERL